MERHETRTYPTDEHWQASRDGDIDGNRPIPRQVHEGPEWGKGGEGKSKIQKMGTNKIAE